IECLAGFCFHFEKILLLIVLYQDTTLLRVLIPYRFFECHSVSEGPVMRLAADGGAAVTDFTPLTISSCLRHLLIAASKRSWIANSFVRPSNVAAPPISTNSKASPRFSTIWLIARIFPITISISSWERLLTRFLYISTFAPISGASDQCLCPNSEMRRVARFCCRQIRCSMFLTICCSCTPDGAYSAIRSRCSFSNAARLSPGRTSVAE